MFKVIVERQRPVGARRPDPLVRKLNEEAALHNIDGIWFEIRFTRRADADPSQTVYHRLKRKSVWPGARHAFDKRQLSASDLAAHGLRNNDEG